MSLAAVCAWSFLRASLIALVATMLSKGVAAFVGQAASLPVPKDGDNSTGRLAARPTRWRQRGVWTLVLAPFLVPPLLVGYAYSRLALTLIHYPVWNDVTYGVLLLLKFFPAAVVIRVFAPASPVSAEALHLQRLLRRNDEPLMRRLSREFRSWIAGPGRIAIGAFVVVFLLAFQEFEIASLMGITTDDAHSPVSWTVALFDQHAGGLPLGESLRHVLIPLCIELAIVLPAAAVLPAWMSPGLQIRGDDASRAKRRLGSRLLLVATSLLLAAVPAIVVVRGALRAVLDVTAGSDNRLSAFLRLCQSTVPELREIAIGALTSLGAALLACGLAQLLMRDWRSRTPVRGGHSVAVALCSVPGLLGPLVLSLMILGLFQLPGFRALSQSLVPLISVLVLFVLPRAVILFAVTGVSRRTPAAHSAWLLVHSSDRGQRIAGARLIDELQTGAMFWSAVLVWYWCYWELTPASLLAPPAAMSFCVRLYNFMHYGQSNALSTMLVAALAVPTVTVVVLARLRPLLVRWVLQ